MEEGDCQVLNFPPFQRNEPSVPSVEPAVDDRGGQQQRQQQQRREGVHPAAAVLASHGRSGYRRCNRDILSVDHLEETHKKNNVVRARSAAGVAH